MLAERDTIAQLKLSIVDRELAVAHARARNSAALHGAAAHLGTRGGGARRARGRGTDTLLRSAAPPGGVHEHPVRPPRRRFRLLPAPGTNYKVNQEPIIAARLDQLGKALQLHLIGISGYRSPQHSVEVGGFADDPHTHGEASDTPGVEGVPESTLLEFCLTRPFPGAREADHIQES